MNRRFFLAATGGIAVLPASLRASTRPRIAIIARGDGSIDAESVGRLVTIVTGALLRTGHFDVVERQRISSILAEQGFSNSAYADPETAAQLGRIAGASRILSLDVSLEASDEAGAYVRYHTYQVAASFLFVGVESAKILAAGSAAGGNQQMASAGSSGSAFGLADQQRAFRGCAEDLVSQLEGVQ